MLYKVILWLTMEHPVVVFIVFVIMTTFVRIYSPERSPREILLDLDSTHNIFKDKIPKAKEEMEDKLQVMD